MSLLPLTVSFYTSDTPYEQEVKYLQASCERYGVEYEFDAVPSSGSWEMNCAFKPIYLLKKLTEKRRPILWVDADAVFVKPLESLDVFQTDLAVRIRSHCSDQHPSKVASGTVFVNYTENGQTLLRLWAQECLDRLADKERKEEVWDQDALRNVVFTKPHKAVIGSLPVSYCKIAGHYEDEQECQDPVIVHNQASRKYKRMINNPSEPFFTL